MKKEGINDILLCQQNSNNKSDFSDNRILYNYSSSDNSDRINDHKQNERQRSNTFYLKSTYTDILGSKESDIIQNRSCLVYCKARITNFSSSILTNCELFPKTNEDKATKNITNIQKITSYTKDSSNDISNTIRSHLKEFSVDFKTQLA